MDGFFVLLGIAILALPVVAIVALVMSVGNRNRLRVLDQRFIALEHRLIAAGAGAVAPPTASEAEPIPSASPPEPIPQPEAMVPDEPAATSHAEPIAPDEAVAPEAAAPPAPEPTAAHRPAAPAMSLEERLGTQWAVWVGAIALALGGIFLVRYSIEAGLLGPGVRVALGALLAIALIVAGEWARRTERLAGISGLPSAHIPSILTAVGTVVAYADVYVSYALYDFLNPGLAFILLGVVALATLAAALLHGPALAGLGLVGAYVTPLLGRERAAGFLVALHLPRDRDRGRLRARPHPDVALARAHGDYLQRALDVSRTGISTGRGNRRACVSRRDGICAGRAC